MLDNSKKYVRVSEILSAFNNFNHINPSILAAKAQIGTNVHEAIESIINDEFPIISHKELGYVQSYEKWQQEQKPTYLMTEKRFYDDKLMITGKIDALVSFPDHQQVVLIDFKTSVKENPITWPMQAHLYYYLLQQNNLEHVTPCFQFIKLDKSGKQPKVYKYDFDNQILTKCLDAVKAFWMKSVDNNLIEV